jgi:hypothetical protein
MGVVGGQWLVVGESWAVLCGGVVGFWFLVLRWSEVFRETAAMRSTNNQKTNNSLSVR